jgi:hypothetical protein
MRSIRVTRIGTDFQNDSARFQVEVGGSEEVTFEILVSNTEVTATARPIEERIGKRFAGGPLPKPGETVRFENTGW